MPIKLNGTTFNNGGTVTFNGQTVKEIKFGTTTVWLAQSLYFPDGDLSFATGGAGSSSSVVTSTYMRATCNGSSQTNANCHSTTTTTMTGVSQVKFTVSARSKSGNAVCCVGVTKTQNPNTLSSYTNNGGKGAEVSATGVVTIDVSSLTGGGFYVCCSVWGSTGGASITIDQIEYL